MGRSLRFLRLRQPELGNGTHHRERRAFELATVVPQVRNPRPGRLALEPKLEVSQRTPKRAGQAVA